MSDRKPLSLRDAKRLVGRFVYGLSDNDGIFYVGQTRSPRRRFQQHSEAVSGNTQLRERLRAPHGEVVVVILHENPADLRAAEREEIRARGSTILNLVGADHFSWSKQTDIPWGAGTGIHSPTGYTMMRCGPEVRALMRARLATMTPAERCVCEVNLLRSLPHYYQRRFSKWLAITRDKMIACMEAADAPRSA